MTSSETTRHLKRIRPDFAGYFVFGTMLVNRLGMNNLVVGSDRIPEWTRSSHSSAEFEGWVEFAGDRRGPRLPIPRLYKYVGVMGVSEDQAYEVQALNPSARPALAVSFGRGVCVGEYAVDRTFEKLPQYDGFVVAAGAIGRGALRAMPVLYNCEQDLVVPIGDVVEVDRLSIDDLDSRLI